MYVKNSLIAERSGKNFSISSNIGLFCSRIVAPVVVKDLATIWTKGREHLKRINDCVVGNFLIKATEENIYECVGALAGAASLSYVISTQFEEMGSNLGLQAGTIAAYGLGILASHIAYKIKKNEPDTIEKICKIGALGIACAVAGNSFLPHAAQSAGSIVGKQIGDALGSYTGGILGGYIAIKLYGSDEVLINLQSPVDSYMLKTTQSSLACAVGKIFLKTNFLVEPVVDQIISTLAFHSLSVIIPTYQSLREGHILDNVLLDKPQKNIKVIQAQLHQLISTEIKKNPALDLNNPLFTRLITLMPELSTYKLSEQDFFHKFIININTYIDLLKSDRTYIQAHENFRSKFIAFFKEDSVNPTLKQERKKAFEEAKQQLQNSIKKAISFEDRIEESLNFLVSKSRSEVEAIFERIALDELNQLIEKDDLLDQEALETFKAALLPLFKEQGTHLLKNYEKSALLQETKDLSKNKLKEIIRFNKEEVLNNLFSLNHVSIQIILEKLSNEIINQVVKQEKKIFGYPITSELQSKYLQTFSEIHLATFSLFLEQAMKKNSSIFTEDDIRLTYKYLNDFALNHYQLTAKIRLIRPIANLFDNLITQSQKVIHLQIENSNLRQINAKEFFKNCFN